MKNLKDIALEVAELVTEKNKAYGSAFSESAKILQVLYPNGIKPEQYGDLLLIVRILDKIFRIANLKNAFGESPFKDILGYSLLGLWKDSNKNDK